MSPKLFQDEIEARTEETRWKLDLDSGQAPFREENYPHVGEGGCTTTYFQGGKLVGLSTRVRDDYNRTLLLCVDLRES